MIFFAPQIFRFAQGAPQIFTDYFISSIPIVIQRSIATKDLSASTNSPLERGRGLLEYIHVYASEILRFTPFRSGWQEGARGYVPRGEINRVTSKKTLFYGRYHVVFLTVQRWCKPRAESNLFGYAEVQLIFASAKIQRQKRDVKCFGIKFQIKIAKMEFM